MLSRTISELSQLIDRIFDTLRFWATLGAGQRTMFILIGLIGKRVVDFLLLIEFFSLGVTAEALRAKRDRKSAI